MSCKEELYRKGGAQWITNIQTANPNTPLTLYPTGDCTIAHGRKYVAFPVGYQFTPKEKEKYNIM
jgi:hypothetical protein